MRKQYFLLAIIPLVLLSSSCATLLQPPLNIPLPFETLGEPAQARHLTVLLPGIRDRMQDFHRQGFLQVAHKLLKEQPDTALLAVDAHWGYYRQRIVDHRIREDILQQFPGIPVTFVGISLGGFGSLLMATQHPDRIHQLVLLSPYLGGDDYQYLERLKQSGPVDQPSDGDEERALNRIWRYLLDPDRRVQVTIAWGADDDFAPYYEQLMAQHPANVTFLPIRGNHDWDTWRSLWRALAPMAISGDGKVLDRRHTSGPMGAR